MINYLYHHGIKGMKWGVRRFQNTDGSLTPAGKKRYIAGQGKTDWDYSKDRESARRRIDPIGEKINDEMQRLQRQVRGSDHRVEYGILRSKTHGDSTGDVTNSRSQKTSALSDTAKRNLKIGLGVAAAAVVTYSAYKVGKNYINAKELMRLKIDRDNYSEMFDSGRHGMMRGAELMDRADKLRLNKVAGADSAINMAKRYREESENLMREGFDGRARTVSEMGRILSNESNLDTSIREFFEEQLGH